MIRLSEYFLIETFQKINLIWTYHHKSLILLKIFEMN